MREACKLFSWYTTPVLGFLYIPRAGPNHQSCHVLFYSLFLLLVCFLPCFTPLLDISHPPRRISHCLHERKPRRGFFWLFLFLRAFLSLPFPPLFYRGVPPCQPTKSPCLLNFFSKEKRTRRTFLTPTLTRVFPCRWLGCCTVLCSMPLVDTCQ